MVVPRAAAFTAEAAPELQAMGEANVCGKRASSGSVSWWFGFDTKQILSKVVK